MVCVLGENKAIFFNYTTFTNEISLPMGNYSSSVQTLFTFAPESGLIVQWIEFQIPVLTIRVRLPMRSLKKKAASGNR